MDDTSIFKGLFEFSFLQGLKNCKVLLPIMDIWHVMRHGGGIMTS